MILLRKLIKPSMLTQTEHLHVWDCRKLFLRAVSILCSVVSAQVNSSMLEVFGKSVSALMIALTVNYCVFVVLQNVNN